MITINVNTKKGHKVKAKDIMQFYDEIESKELKGKTEKPLSADEFKAMVKDTNKVLQKGNFKPVTGKELAKEMK